MQHRPLIRIALAITAWCGAWLPAAITHAGDRVPPTQPVATTTATQTPTFVFCGVLPSDPRALRATAVFAALGIDATMGPCLQPPADYTPAHPGGRYATPETYRRLVTLNASFGMKTIVYDARLWSADDTVRAAALAFWAPQLSHILWWDMGDEFRAEEWPILLDRWQIMWSLIYPVTNIRPYTGVTPADMPAAVRDLRGAAPTLLSFNNYGPDFATSAARWASAADVLVCHVNALQHFGLIPTAGTIRKQMWALADAGCDTIGIFGGIAPYGLLAGMQMGPDSIVTASGGAGPMARGVVAGSAAPSKQRRLGS